MHPDDSLAGPELPPRLLCPRPELEDERWFIEEVYPLESKLRGWVRKHFTWVTDVDDLIHDGYVRLIRAKREGKVAHASSYLFATVRNAAFDHGRRHKIVAIDSIADVGGLNVLDERGTAAEDLNHDQELQLLAAAVQALPERCRLVFKLRKLRGLTHREIATQMGISVHTVNAQLTTAMRLCKQYLQEHGVKPE